jgi:hypothetical protein
MRFPHLRAFVVLPLVIKIDPKHMHFVDVLDGYLLLVLEILALPNHRSWGFGYFIFDRELFGHCEILLAVFPKRHKPARLVSLRWLLLFLTGWQHIFVEFFWQFDFLEQT